MVVAALLIGKAVSAQTGDQWTKYLTPNQIHKMMGEYVGEFNVEISMWMTEGKAPEIINVSSSNKMILGDRFLEMTQSGNMMGMEYSSVSTIGYNTIDESFSLTTLTNMGTGTLYLKGNWDPGNSTAMLKGQTINPIDNKAMEVRQRITFIDKNNLLIENLDTYQGQKERKSIQYRLVRKQ